METRTGRYDVKPENRRNRLVGSPLIIIIGFLFSIIWLWFFVNGSTPDISEETFIVIDIGRTEEGKEVAIIRRHGELVTVPVRELGDVSKGDTLVGTVKGKEILNIRKE